MLSPFRLFLAPEAQTFTAALSPSNPSSSVTSVTSVRCFPRLPGSRPGSPNVHRSAFPINPILLCDLRDLCAMLSPFRLFLAPEAPVSTESLLPPLCDLRNLCDLPPLLKGNPHGDLCAMQGQLIEEIVVAFIAKIVIKISVTNLGKDASRELAT
jgi:hypothetical protein